ncbi:MAG TPA: DegV family protein [Acholeplasmataceae bacterium]|nr:DegV family protein [Acholeplasmataceae bacterium]
MAKIAIVSDVNAGLDYLGYDPKIPVLRSVINFGEEHLVDGIDIKAEEFYERLSKITSSKDIPSTSAPTVGETMELVEKLITEGYTDIIMYAISYQLSSIGSTFESMKQEYGDKVNIHVVNTKVAAYLQGYLAVEAKRMVEDGKSVEEILAYSDSLIKSCKAYFVVDDLSYLVKNGRLSGMSGFLGGLLKIKPVLHITEDGKIVPKEKVKTHRKAVERAIFLVEEEIKKAKKVKLFVFHTLREDDAKEILKYFKDKYSDIADCELHMVTPAVGAHIGTKILGIGYFILNK